jgi:2-keto-4-pentenoate hydratase/2-oxohepta-3-ene-1,7-dioic acid hydratase in catechol pathway
VGKWLDTFGPMGPWITLKDEVPNLGAFAEPMPNLEIEAGSAP